MVRIKGANSDYKYVKDSQQSIKEDKQADPLYMELFICPNDMPSRVEANDGNYCRGTDEQCPSREKDGHAKIRLDQQQGIILSVKDTEALKVAEQKIVLQIGKANTKIEITPEATILQTGKAKICLRSNGEIELQGKVLTDNLIPEETKDRLKAEILEAVLAQMNPPTQN